MNPPCPSGRPNHDCRYLENLAQSEGVDIPPPCRRCAIGEIGTMTLGTGAAFYIMTSARDILFDVFVPSLDRKTFSSGLFVLCRYSLRPFAAGLVASGIRGWLFPFEQGDCQDYRTWLLADRGIKDEQTTLGEPRHGAIRGLLEGARKEMPPGSLLYEALARPRDEPHRTFFILVPYFTTAVGGLVSNIVFGPVAVAGYLVTGLGDAIGEPAGTMFGKHQYRVWSLLSVPATRSFEGSTAVFIMSVGALLLTAAVSPQITLAALGVPKVLVIATASTLVEAVSPHGWDNATMQIVPTALAFVWLT
jgi:dolichol kinase